MNMPSGTFSWWDLLVCGFVLSPCGRMWDLNDLRGCELWKQCLNWLHNSALGGTSAATKSDLVSQGKDVTAPFILTGFSSVRLKPMLQANVFHQTDKHRFFFFLNTASKRKRVKKSKEQKSHFPQVVLHVCFSPFAIFIFVCFFWPN